MAGLNARVVDLAKKELGVKEVPNGSNLGPRVNEYKAFTWLDPKVPWPWCVAFALWVVDKALKADGGQGFPRRTAGTSDLYQWAKKEGWVVNTPRPGDIATIGSRHTTLVYKVEGKTFQGLGGNQNNEVNVTRFPITSEVGFIRVPASFDDSDPNLRRRANRAPFFQITRDLKGRRKIVRVKGRKRVVKTINKILKRNPKARVNIRRIWKRRKPATKPPEVDVKDGGSIT